MPKHERMKLPRQSMPIQDAEARGRNYDEVALGYRDRDGPVGGAALPPVPTTQVRARPALIASCAARR